jgi:hypothetical protein
MSVPDITRQELDIALLNQSNPATIDSSLRNLQTKTAAYQRDQDQITSDAAMRQATQDATAALNKLKEDDQSVLNDLQGKYNTLQAQLINCSAQDYINIKNLIKAHAATAKHNATLVKSVAIQDSIKRLEGVERQNSYLKQEKADLIASIEQHERDFVDLRDALPEVLPNSSIHTLDDYTLWILIMSYSLFVISVIFYYCYINAYTPTAILISTISAALLTMFLFLLGIVLL